jgi:hypothetical protein
MYQILILRRLLASICWRKSRVVRAFQPPAPMWIQHPGIQTKNPLRSYLQRSEERSAHINISLVEAPTIQYYYYYYSILENASLHNVTMRIVTNGFDDALHIAFGETLLGAHERWMGSSLTMSREDECIMNRAVEGVLGWWPVERAGDMTCLSDACEGRKEGKTDGWTDNELVIYGRSAATAPACLLCHMHAKKGRTDIDAHNVKTERNMKIVPFKGVLWLLGGARRQLHGKRRLRVVWLVVGAGRQVRLSCMPRKDGHGRLRQKH